jgi:predicted phage terminase large subunit-like protein
VNSPRPSDETIRADAQSDLLFYTQLCDPKYTVSRVHAFIANKLEQVDSGKIKRLILSMPPQHGKSRLCSIEFPTWTFAKKPSTKFVLASYAQSLCNVASRHSRARMKLDVYQSLTSTRPDSSNTNVEDWGIEGGGGFRAVGIGGALTGRGADIIVIDDPFKGFAEAHSLLQRDRVWDWFLSDAFTRLAPDGKVVIIMTRWHKDDLVGRLTDPLRQQELVDAGVGDEKWEYINIQGLAPEDEPDPLGRKPGEAVFPEKYTAEMIKAKMKVMGSYKSAALYCGKPVLRGGNYIGREQFKLIKQEQVPTGLTWKRFWDLGATDVKHQKKSTEPDYTAGVRCALHRIDGNTKHLYIANMVKGQWKWPVARSKIKSTAEAERILVGVEAVAGFKTAFANLREVVDKEIVLHEIGVEKDKLTRALPWIALAEAGCVFIVEGDWVTNFFDEVEAFPNGLHDDQVDAVSGCFAMCSAGRKILVA